MAHPITAMSQALDGHSTTGWLWLDLQRWLDLVRGFVYLSAVPAHGLSV